MYLLESKIESLSARLKAYSKTESTYREYVDTKITEDNLRNNIAHTIAKAILAAEIPAKPTMVNLNGKINDYNRLHGTSLASEWYLSNQWIRIINDKIIFPSSVAKTLRSDEDDQIPVNFINQVSCLKELYAEFVSEDSVTLDQDTLLVDLTKQEIQLLTDRNIIHKVSDGKYKWHKSEYTRHLRNEICSSVWVLLYQNELFADFNERVKRYAEIIQFYEIDYPDRVTKFIQPDKVQKLHEAALNVLLSENDLLDSGSEFKKSWLDAPSYARKQPFESTPTVILNKQSTFQLLEQIDSLDNWFQGVLELDESRSIYHVLLNHIIQTDQGAQRVDQRYLGIQKIMNDLSRPYLVNWLFWYLKGDHQYVLPVFLNSYNLAPIVFKAINEIEFNEKVLVKSKENETADQIRSAIYKLKSEVWIDAFDAFLLKLSVNLNPADEAVSSLFQILWSQAKLFFKKPTNYDHEIHSEERRRFEIAIKRLSEVRPHGGYHGGVKPRIFPRVVSGLFAELQKLKEVSHYDSIYLNQPAFEFAIQLLKFCNIPLFKGEISKNELDSLKILKDDIAGFLCKNVQEFFICQEIPVVNYNTGLIEMKKPKWGNYPFGFEILEWGSFYIHIHEIGQLSNFVKSIESQFRFEKKHGQGRYHDLNSETYEKVRLFLKSIACAVIQIKESPSNYEAIYNNIVDLTDTLFELLKKYSLRFCVDDLQNDRINAFDERFRLTHDLYYQNVLSVVFKAMNFQPEELTTEFIKQYIQEDKNLIRLLGIVNLIEGHASKRILYEELQTASIEDFISSSRVTTDWREAMIEAINTEEFFEFAVPLSQRLEAHLNNVKHLNENDSLLLFEVKLLHAFKTKNLDKLNDITVPVNQYVISNRYRPAMDLKRFFVGLHKLYNTNEYDDALKIFEELHSNDTANGEYAYRLFHARTIRAKSNLDSAELKLAMEFWKDFSENPTNEARKTLQSLDHNIKHTSIHYYLHFEEFASLDTTLQQLPSAYLYDSEIVQGIFDAYLKRQLDELAYSYLSHARKYYVDNGLQVPTLIESLYSTIDDTKYISRLRTSFSEIQTLPPDKFVRTVPGNLNSGKTVEEFILNEIVRAGKILMEKVRALDKVPIEDKYNDLLQSILRFRFPVWGWTISDQGRTGASSTEGDDLGSSDFMVQCADECIALIEAMIIEGKNKSKTEEHVVKCNKYVSHTSRFYLVSYFKGKPENFVKTWDAYQQDVLSINFDDTFILLKNEFIDISSSLRGTRNIKVGKTAHCNGITFFHIFLNISGSQVLLI
ncbi:MAG: hypothetical protein ABI663_06940 [Chryseolinea sp.]